MKKIFVLVFIFSIAATAQQNINSSGKESSKALALTIAANGVAATYFFMKCPPSNWVACAMGAITVAQAIAQVGTKKGANNTDYSSQCYGLDCSSVGTGSGGASSGAADGLSNSTLLEQSQQKLNNIKNQLAGMGYTYDPSTNKINMPGGKSIDASALGSAAGMKAAGMSDEQIADAQATIAAANAAADNEFKRLSKLLGSGGEGGGGAAFKKTKYVDGNGIDMSKYLAQLKGGRGIASVGVEGLQKTMGNDSIGVAGDNIFKMIHRRYENQRQKGEFVP